jgi:hypothetical protein
MCVGRWQSGFNKKRVTVECRPDHGHIKSKPKATNLNYLFFFSFSVTLAAVLLRRCILPKACSLPRVVAR